MIFCFHSHTGNVSLMIIVIRHCVASVGGFDADADADVDSGGDDGGGCVLLHF